MHGFSKQPLHGKQRAEREGRAVIGEPAVQVAKAGHHAVLLDPPDRLRVIQAGVHMHKAAGGAVRKKQNQKKQEQQLQPADSFRLKPPEFRNPFSQKQSGRQTEQDEQQIRPGSHTAEQTVNLGIYRQNRQPRHPHSRHAAQTVPQPFKGQQARKARDKSRY